MKTKIKTLILASLLTLGSMTANAVPVTWSITDVVFSDGGTASGTFVYDNDTGVYSNVNITTTAGGVFGGATHIVEHVNFPTGTNSAIHTMASAIGPFAGLVAGMRLAWDGFLTNAGGEFAIVSGFEGFCGNATCSNAAIDTRVVKSGKIASVPEPATLALLGIALLGLALGRKKAAA